ncbi:hypothetical protein DL96DRAFT_1450685, partial [Flagelloscypha sp. PMI_526]
GVSEHVYGVKTSATGKVTILKMNLTHQHRKELIACKIFIMKESGHPNIIFLESYRVKANEL